MNTLLSAIFVMCIVMKPKRVAKGLSHLTLSKDLSTLCITYCLSVTTSSPCLLPIPSLTRSPYFYSVLTAKEKPPINVVGDVGGKVAIIVVSEVFLSQELKV